MGVHTLVLAIYYWSFSPIGLPSSPEWLDLGHTWVTGVPVHFGVIYLGYLLALWLWRRRTEGPGDDSAAGETATTALGVSGARGGVATEIELKALSRAGSRTGQSGLERGCASSRSAHELRGSRLRRASRERNRRGRREPGRAPRATTRPPCA